MSPAEAASLRSSSPVDEALLQRIRTALVGKDVNDDTDAAKPASAATNTPKADATAPADEGDGSVEDTAAEASKGASQNTAEESAAESAESVAARQ
jgi:hypothetical protein